MNTDALIQAALDEDLGTAGDITSASTIPAESEITAEMVARAPGVVAGVDVAIRVFQIVDPDLTIEVRHRDGDAVDGGTVLATIAGSARSMLTAERTALNFLGHLSGIATATGRLVERVAGTGARICDTRKTTPGLRGLEKAAVRAGGGANHRFGLHDAVLIKDNHIEAAGSVTAAVTAARRGNGHTVKIEVEVETLEQLAEALAVEPDIVMLDNMSLAEMTEAVHLVRGSCIVEASGGINEDTVRGVAETGVDVISVGWITHSAPSLDVALDVVPG
jgi:nicotinate-nucleotide pyrophosphorylase (carboxylating)